MNWLILIVAGLCEVVWAVALKKSDGFRNVWADAIFLVGMVASMWFLSLSLRTIPLGTAYAVWTGVGAVGGFVAGIVMFGFVAGIVMFGEPATALRIASAALIVAGIVGLKLAAK